MMAWRSLLGASLALVGGLACSGPDSVSPTWSERVQEIDSEPVPNPLLEVSDPAPEPVPEEPVATIEDDLETLTRKLDRVIHALESSSNVGPAQPIEVQLKGEGEILESVRTLGSVFCVIGGGLLIALGVLFYRLNHMPTSNPTHIGASSI
jgi:hypothetical protein